MPAASTQIKNSISQQIHTIRFSRRFTKSQIPVIVYSLSPGDLCFRLVGEDARPLHWPAFQSIRWSHETIPCMSTVTTNINAGSAITTPLIMISPSPISTCTSSLLQPKCLAQMALVLELRFISCSYMPAIDTTRHTADLHITCPHKSDTRHCDRPSSLTMNRVSQLSHRVLSSMSARTSQLCLKGGTIADVSLALVACISL